MKSAAANRYARALFALALERGELERIDRDLLHVVQSIRQEPACSRFIASPTITDSEKESFMNRVFSDHLSLLSVNFLKLLVAKRRFGELEAIQEEYHFFYEKNIGVQEVVAVSAVPLSDSNKSRLMTVLRQKLRSEIRLIPEVDPHILGGLILRFDGIEINGSYKNRIRKIAQKLQASYEGT
ncbi:MAG: ATP synthase F1 subunit delta [Candidatus Omnitrophica bacterium]|nr:ATP synthase F1 subunit delta [Candidatus Omnitrophota bacterium]